MNQQHPVAYRKQQLAGCGATPVPLLAHQWQPKVGVTRAQLVVVHGYMEHGGRYRDLAHYLAQHGYATLCIDLRGHGRSAGPRGYVARFDDYLDDIEYGLGAVLGPQNGAAHALQPPRFLIGHSLGGLIALDLVQRRVPSWAGLILTNPYLADAVAPPAYKRMIGRLAGRLWPRLNLPAGLKREGLSHDAAYLASHGSDPLVFGHANAAWFRETRLAQRRVVSHLHLPTPVLYVYSDADPIASPRANAAYAAAIVAADKRVVLRKGELHEVLNEVDRSAFYAELMAWVEARIPNFHQ